MKKTLNRGFASIGLAIMAFALLAMGGGGYYILTQPSVATDIKTPTLQDFTNSVPAAKKTPPPTEKEEQTATPPTEVSESLTVNASSGDASFTANVTARIEVSNNQQGSAIIFFGDGTSDVVQRASSSLYSEEWTHRYPRPGTYEVILVTSSVANVDADIEALKNPFYSKNTVVERKSVAFTLPSSSSFQASPLSGTAPLTVTFTDMGSVTGISYGDGATCSDMAPGAPESVWCHSANGVLKSHTYTRPGTYLVRASRSTPSGTVGEVTIDVR